jgi:dihydroorotate dehydrogenase electron transfer subunit
MRQVKAPVISNTEIMPDTHLVWLQASEIAAAAKPGQFVMVRCINDFNPLLRRPLSIHRVTDTGQLAILFNIVGHGTKLLSKCQTGNEIDLVGPLGKGYSMKYASNKSLLVAGGIGIAPLVFTAEEALKEGNSPLLIIGAQNSSMLYPRAMLSPSINVITVTEDGSDGKHGIVTDFITDYINQVDAILACGPTSMYQTMAEQCKMELKSVQISLELRMACGRGICYGCSIKTKNGLKQVCQDGPVFELSDIDWDVVKLQ